MTRAIGVDPDCSFTPQMLRKVVYAGNQSGSFAQAHRVLRELGESSVSVKRIERWTERIGNERVTQTQVSADAYQQLPLPARQQSPREQVPQLACVQMDGGRLQIRDRANSSAQAGATHWREYLVGSLYSMTSDVHEDDPSPVIPGNFVDSQRMSTLSREIKGISGLEEDAPELADGEEVAREGRPQPLVRSVVATHRGALQFGRRLIAAAYARGFNAAPRKAFICDGSATNWSVHRKHFSHYTPILDFTHAICYIWSAATAGRSLQTSWDDYRTWAQYLWNGQVKEIIEALTHRLTELGPAADEESETSPRRLVESTLTYLQNQRKRMNYPEYRRLGLPITSSHIESTIKQINRRVKGTEKFWDKGAEPMLQLAADHMGDTEEMDRFWKSRPATLRPQRTYQAAA